MQSTFQERVKNQVHCTVRRSSGNNDDSKFMFAAQSHVRNACDACHKRKIRCIVSRSGGPCHNCKSRGLSCYFLPRYKSGRPRIGGPPSPDTIDSHTVPLRGSIINGSLWPEAEKSVPSDPARKSPPSRPDHQNSNEDLFVWDSHQDVAIQTEQHSHDLQDSDQPLRFSSVMNDNLLDIQQPTFLNFANPTRHDFTNIQSDDLPGAPSVWSTTSQQPSDRSGRSNETSKEAGFASLLEYCARLQRHIMTAEEDDSTISDEGAPSTSKKSGISDGRLQEVLEDIDASCKLMLDICDEESSPKSTSAQVSSPPDSASICLMTTVTFKVFQICDILFNGQGLRVRSIKDVLLQKRLDFNITQARIVTARIGHLTQNRIQISHELSKKAVQVEERFTSQRGASYKDVGKFCS